MERFLTVALRVWFPKAERKDSAAALSDAGGGGMLDARTVHIGGKSAGFALYQNGLEPQPRASAFGLYGGLLSVATTTASGSSGAGTSTGGSSSSRDNAREFALDLVPLLLDMWVEVDPDNDCLHLVEAMLSLYEEGDVIQPKDAHFVLDFFHSLILGPLPVLEAV
ncbi:hypothetical protein V5799_026910 [Amblyomma americanum]|uniref:Uncharacterized protein n=1 Tax=Amblyomma americanum TaxID=6943 RepID=A0AAQ4DH83_AMBAM